jgi:hypothetical protein
MELASCLLSDSWNCEVAPGILENLCTPVLEWILKKLGVKNVDWIQLASCYGCGSETLMNFWVM